ncbi:hypothetical protein OG405_20760 [Nocardia sp. NBC_01329]|nr:hypothetical protein OG405_20760 [Nocardia sp. NBC_01329]
MQGLGAQVEHGLLQCRFPGSTDRGSGGRFQRGLRENALHQLFYRDPDRDPGRYLSRGRLRGGCRGADAGGCGGEGHGHFDGEDRQTGQDHQFGLLDIGRTVTDLVGEGFDMGDQTVERALAVPQLGPSVRDRLRGVAFDRCQHLVDRVIGVGVQASQIGGELCPRRLDPPHRGLVALRPVTGSHNVFRHPLQRFRDLDTHSAHSRRSEPYSRREVADTTFPRTRAAHHPTPQPRQQIHHPYPTATNTTWFHRSEKFPDLSERAELCHPSP